MCVYLSVCVFYHLFDHMQRPLLQEVSPMLTQAFGKPEDFTFNLTHILLVAILLALLSVQGGFASSYANNYRAAAPAARHVQNEVSTAERSSLSELHEGAQKTARTTVSHTQALTKCCRCFFLARVLSLSCRITRNRTDYLSPFNDEQNRRTTVCVPAMCGHQCTC
jgi:hypothetical protein